MNIFYYAAVGHKLRLCL